MMPQNWILPSAESKYADGVDHLRLYVAGLHANPQTSRELNQRNVELVTLFEAWSDLAWRRARDALHAAKS